jgi:hypothetical protein
MYGEDGEPEVARLLGSFLNRQLAYTQQQPPSAAAAASGLVHALVGHLCRLGDTVTRAARLTLHRAVAQLHPPAPLLGDAALNELRVIVGQQVPREHSEGSRDILRQAALDIACRFASLGMPAGDASRASSDGAPSPLPPPPPSSSCAGLGRLLCLYPRGWLAGTPASRGALRTLLCERTHACGGGGDARQWLVRHSCACIGSPCLRNCVHGASIGGGRGASRGRLPARRWRRQRRR